MKFQASAECPARSDDDSVFQNLAASAKKDPAVGEKEIEAGKARQKKIRHRTSRQRHGLDEETAKPGNGTVSNRPLADGVQRPRLQFFRTTAAVTGKIDVRTAAAPMVNHGKPELADLDPER